MTIIFIFYGVYLKYRETGIRGEACKYYLDARKAVVHVANDHFPAF